MAGHFRGLFLTSSQRSVPVAVAWTVALTVLTAAAHRDAFFSRPSWGPDGHSALSLHLALADTYCDRRAHISRDYDVAAAISTDRDLLRVPFPQILSSVAGSVEAYCTTVVHPALNNENSLMLVIAAATKANPQLSPGGLGRGFGLMRLALIAVFGYAILISGGSVLATLAGLWICGDVLQGLKHLQYTVYPFLAPALLGLGGLYVVLVRHARWSGWISCVVGSGLGALTAFFANVRSSHLPVYLAFFLIYAAVALRQARDRRTMWQVALSVIAFGAGYLLFAFLLIRPLVPSGPHTNYAYHTVAHPLVLGLAIPPSDLSRREGIVWNDAAALEIARRVNPDAVYLGETYETALFEYYRSLWRRYPGEMLRLYTAKLQAAAAGMLSMRDGEAEHTSTARTLAALGLRPPGTLLMLIYAATLVTALVAYRRNNSPLGLLIALLAVAAIAVLAEAAIIIPTFRLMYHAYLLIFTALLVLSLVQILVDYASALVQKQTRGSSHVAANH